MVPKLGSTSVIQPVMRCASLALMTVLALACHRSAPPIAGSATTARHNPCSTVTADAAVTASIHGEILVAEAGPSAISVPCRGDAAPNCGTSVIVLVAELRNPTRAPVWPATMQGLEVLDASGRPEAIYRSRLEWVELDDASITAALTAPFDDPGWDGGPGRRLTPAGQAILAEPGHPFDGASQPGTTRIRVRAFLDGFVRTQGARVRLTLRVGNERVELDGELVRDSWASG